MHSTSPKMPAKHVMTVLGQEWKALPAVQKQRYESTYGAEKAAYQRQKEEYERQYGKVTSPRSQKAPKEAAAKPPPPRRPNNAFLLFSRDRRAAVMDSTSPKMKAPEVAVVLGKEWQALPAAQKQSYETTANAEREVYQREREEYERQHGKIRRVGKKALKEKKLAKKAAAKSKRTLSPYNLYMQEHFPAAKGALPPGEKHTKAFGIVAAKWKELSESEKLPYVRLAEAAKQRTP